MPQVRSLLVLSLILTGMASAAPARAEDFYKGKTVTILVGFSPAGGYDTNARALARHLAKHIPGNPGVIVQNMPGAGSLTAVRSLEATQPKDGTVVAIFNPGLVTQSVVEPKLVNVDFSKLAWVGVITPDFRVCYGFGSNGVKNWDDMMSRKQFVLGSTGKGSGNYINGATLREVFHAPIKQVLGFPGSAEQRLAIERGELDGDCGSFSSVPIDWVMKGLAHIFIRFSEKKQPEIPGSAVYVGNFAKTDEQRQILSVVDGADEIGRPFVMSGQVPRERIAIMRQAFNDTMKDPDFLADMQKQMNPVIPLTGEAAEAIVVRLMKTPPAIAAKAKEIYQ